MFTILYHPAYLLNQNVLKHINFSKIKWMDTVAADEINSYFLELHYEVLAYIIGYSLYRLLRSDHRF